MSGAATVILAMGAGKRAAAGIADYLVKEGLGKVAASPAPAVEETAAADAAAAQAEADLVAALVSAGVDADLAARAAAAVMTERAK